MKLDQQCGVCRSYTWCGRMCRNAPTIYEAPGATEKPVQSVPKPKAAKVAKPKKTPTEAVSESPEGFNRAAYQKEYMREYMRKRRGKAKGK